jgi:hypothetical protein
LKHGGSEKDSGDEPLFQGDGIDSAVITVKVPLAFEELDGSGCYGPDGQYDLDHKSEYHTDEHMNKCRTVTPVK